MVLIDCVMIKNCARAGGDILQQQIFCIFMKKKIPLVLCFLLLLSVVVSALELPASIQKIIDYNNQQAAYYLENITYIVAFLAGLLAILSPCTLAIVPMYFSYGLKEKSTWHTFTFFF